MRDYRDAKLMAKAMREALAARNLEISHSEALEIVARQFGVETWNVLSSKIETKPPETGIAFEQAVPIVRIFDVAKAQEFYLGFLGFSVDWEHRYGENFPLYTQVSRAGLRLHGDESRQRHRGDAQDGGAQSRQPALWRRRCRYRACRFVAERRDGRGLRRRASGADPVQLHRRRAALRRPLILHIISRELNIRFRAQHLVSPHNDKTGGDRHALKQDFA